MNESDSSSNRVDSTQNTCDGDISEVIKTVVKQVEHLTCSKLTNLSNSSIDDSSEPACKFGQANNLRLAAESSNDRSKHRSGNRRSRVRQRKHKWKPYHKLTGDERRRLEERISRRAYRSREKMFASGLTLAPYNTTQFLMEDHNLQTPDYNIHHESKNKDDDNSSDYFYSSPDDEEEFIQQQFSETYDRFHDAFISEMSKSELVRELIRLEDEIESAEHTLRGMWKAKKAELDVEAELAKIQVFQDEIDKLIQENYQLNERNKTLESQLSSIKA